MAHEHAVTLKLPHFCTTQSRSWFTQAEAQLIIRGIVNDDIRYYYILTSLDQDTAARLLDLLEKPPAEGKYQTIKARLLDTFGIFNWREPLNYYISTPWVQLNHPNSWMRCGLARQSPTLPTFQTTIPGETSGPNWLQLNMKIAGPWPSKQTCSGLQKKWPLRMHWRNWKKQIFFFQKETINLSTQLQIKILFLSLEMGKGSQICQNPCTWPVKEQASHK